MNTNYLKLMFRKLARNKIFSFVSIFGLAAGLALFGIIYLFINYENSFDKFHSNADKIYRLNTTMKYEGTTPSTLSLSSVKMGPFLKNTFPDIDSYTRIADDEENSVWNYNGKELVIPKSIVSDSNFFSIFNFNFLEGDKTTALLNPESIVITNKIAKKIFNNDNPVGKILTRASKTERDTDTTVSLLITGVITIPENSHLQFDAIIASTNPFNQPYLDWHTLAATTYLLAKNPNTDIASIEKNIPAKLSKVMTSSQFVELHIQPLSAIHLNSGYISNETSNYKKFDAKYISILWMVAAFVLLIAVVNFTNLSVSLSGTRTKEIAVKKTVGASKGNIVKQYLGESIFYAFTALILGYLIIVIILPLVSDFTQRTLNLNILFTAFSLSIAIALVVLLGLLGGFYPALIVSSFNPIKSLKSTGNILLSNGKQSFVKGLVVAQFTVAITLIICTVLVVSQLNFLQKTDMGFDKEHIITIPLEYQHAEKYAFLKQQMTQLQGVTDVTKSSKLMGEGFNQNGAAFTDAQGKKSFLAMQCLSVSENFCSFYKMKIIAGQNFSSGSGENHNEYIINEAFAKKTGWKDPIGQTFYFSWDKPGRIVGVVKNFNSESLRKEIEPVAIGATAKGSGIISIRIKTGNMPETLHALEKLWKQNIPDKAFSYRFLDENLAKLYASEKQLSSALSTMSLIIIIISCLGLFALSVFIAQKRIKEIGIRKVLGATVANITIILSADFLKLIFISILIASPVAWWFMNEWLQGFVYRINISWQVFLFTGLAVLLIALVTVSFQAIKAAITNPVKSLRTE